MEQMRQRPTIDFNRLAEEQLFDELIQKIIFIHVMVINHSPSDICPIGPLTVWKPPGFLESNCTDSIRMRISEHNAIF
jgi:hypothetical protein